MGVWCRGGTPPSPDAVERCLTTLRHRGPDDEGYVFISSASGTAATFGGADTPGELRLPPLMGAEPLRGADLCLGVRRLAIQDLTPAGHQPMASADGRLWIAYNGEIYNFIELRGELERLGHAFRSGCDTEVLLAAYGEWGEACFHRFNGMWGVAIWDMDRRALTLCRDRYGVKPLFYRWDGATFAFASEIKALVRLLGVSEPDEGVLEDYLALGLTDQSQRTFFAGIESLPPGHVLELRADSAPSIHAWYHLRATPYRDGDFADGFAALLEDSVAHRLLSDVPVGTCLSGGLDSSAVVCLVDRLLSGGARAGTLDMQLTFSARYADERHDEGTYIDAVVGSTSVRSHVTHPTGESLLQDVERLVRQQDEPFWSTSIYAQWLVFALARSRGAIVTLDGQGGDEVAGGYTHYFGPVLAGLLRSGRIVAFAREARALRVNHGVAVAPLALRTAAALSPNSLRLRLAAAARTPPWLRARGVERPSGAARDVAQPRDPLQAQVWRDIVYGLRPLLRVADRNSMAHSVESRLPFLDYRLVELGFGAPAEAKISGGTTKLPLRNGLNGLLPGAVRNRHDKIGFSTPEDTWFREPLRPLLQEVFSSKSFSDRPWFDAAEAQRVLSRHFAGENRSLELWRLLNTELWLRAFFD